MHTHTHTHTHGHTHIAHPLSPSFSQMAHETPPTELNVGDEPLLSPLPSFDKKIRPQLGHVLSVVEFDLDEEDTSIIIHVDHTHLCILLSLDGLNGKGLAFED